jgi:hypothetical protein
MQTIGPLPECRGLPPSAPPFRQVLFAIEQMGIQSRTGSPSPAEVVRTLRVLDALGLSAREGMAETV